MKAEGETSIGGSLAWLSGFTEAKGSVYGLIVYNLQSKRGFAESGFKGIIKVGYQVKWLWHVKEKLLVDINGKKKIFQN